jgi:hypothetical protein
MIWDSSNYPSQQFKNRLIAAKQAQHWVIHPHSEKQFMTFKSIIPIFGGKPTTRFNHYEAISSQGRTNYQLNNRLLQCQDAYIVFH